MILSRTPYRISFFGGGTDYPAWFKENGGAVIGTTIDKYCYVTCRYLPPFFDHRYRVAYSLIEHAKDVSEIKHPSVRECLRFMQVSKGVEIHHDGDLPAKTGLGSSSSFTVGLLNCLNGLKGKMVSNMQLARDAIHIEQNQIRENVGCQDQILAALGGFNVIEFTGAANYAVSPMIVGNGRVEDLRRHLLLIYTGLSRISSQIAKELVEKTPDRKKELREMHQMVFEAVKILNGNGDIGEFGKLLHENWKIKRSLTDKVSTPVIDEIYEKAMSLGALGGKVLGAGGGGFVLLFARPELHGRIRQALGNFLHVPFHFENSGSRIVFYKPDEYE